MGNFYVNYTLRGATPQAAATALQGRQAIVTRARSGCVVVFDRESDEQDAAVILALGADLSRQLGCTVLAVLNHDDDVLRYQLFEEGEVSDEYESSPGQFDEGEEEDSNDPAGGDAEKLCAAFGVNNALEIEGILRKGSLASDENGYTFECERHADLVRALDLPEFAVAAGYRCVAGGDLPPGLTEKDLLRVI